VYGLGNKQCIRSVAPTLVATLLLVTALISALASISTTLLLIASLWLAVAATTARVSTGLAAVATTSSSVASSATAAVASTASASTGGSCVSKVNLDSASVHLLLVHLLDGTIGLLLRAMSRIRILASVQFPGHASRWNREFARIAKNVLGVFHL